jgi:hypothetical protein
MNQPGLLRGAAAVLAVAALGSCDATQPKPYCRVQQDTYAARYIMQSMQGACTGKVLTGEILHLTYYRAPLTEANGTTSVAIQPESVLEATHELTMSAGMEYSIGKFTTINPGDDDLCKVPTFAETNITTPMARLSYAWSNMQLMVTPVSNAIHFGADLVRKDGDCTVTYKVSAVNPALHCGDGMDMMGHPDPTTGNPNQKACEFEQGSGLSPDLAYTCDATLLCLPSKEFPSRK